MIWQSTHIQPLLLRVPIGIGIPTQPAGKWNWSFSQCSLGPQTPFLWGWSSPMGQCMDHTQIPQVGLPPNLSFGLHTASCGNPTMVTLCPAQSPAVTDGHRREGRTHESVLSELRDPARAFGLCGRKKKKTPKQKHWGKKRRHLLAKKLKGSHYSIKLAH